MSDCIFCKPEEMKDRLIFDTDDWYAVYDGYSVTPGHALLIPKRHVENFWGLGKRAFNEFNEMEMYEAEYELGDMHFYLLRLKEHILIDYPEVTGFNIGINIGETAGQSIFHLHIHVFPRRVGDFSTDPQGGVRHMFGSEKAHYKANR